MKLKLRLFALYRELAGTDYQEIEIPSEVTVASFLESLAQKFPKLKGRLEHALVAVNREYTDPSFSLRNGDEVALIPPVSGGQDIELTHSLLRPEEVIAKVKSDASGAIVTFIGTVRSPSEGEKVRYLEYEAFTEMASQKLAEIAQEIKSRWPVDKVAMAHRLGHVAVGESAVVIAVSAPHRAEAFQACQYAIDRLKEVVPIWKKEVTEAEEAWKER